MKIPEAKAVTFLRWNCGTALRERCTIVDDQFPDPRWSGDPALALLFPSGKKVNCHHCSGRFRTSSYNIPSQRCKRVSVSSLRFTRGEGTGSGSIVMQS